MRLIAKAKASNDPIDEPLRALDWWYPEDEFGDTRMEAVLAEINGWQTNPVAAGVDRGGSDGVVFGLDRERQSASWTAGERFRRIESRRLDRMWLLDLLRAFLAATE